MKNFACEERHRRVTILYEKGKILYLEGKICMYIYNNNF